ncbi:MAG: type II secretion system GspH family protein [Candidatus Magnetominusculus sp. LBB02]|nr:type II secretion system GspH family protein [Candidatus Magnetominusculus sp. LBB02]
MAKMGNAKGFSLIELLVVIAIMSLLTAIAVPAFLGQRERGKVRATEAGAKGAISDIQNYLDSYVAGHPYIIVADTSGTQGCFESSSAAAGDTCLSIYNQASAGTYTAFPGGITDVIAHFISHSTFSGNRSAFVNGLPLFVTASASDGQVVLSATSSRSASIVAYATNSTSPIFSSIVSVR